MILKDKFIYGYDSDVTGDYVINGRRKKDGTITFNKKYHKKHVVVYTGIIDSNNLIKGRWETGGSSGPFEI